MAISGHEHYEGARPQPVQNVIAGGSIGEAIGGLGVIVLAILGLVGFMPLLMAQIATIVLGAAILIEGGTIAARFTRLVAQATPHATATEVVSGGLAMESLAGLVGVILGILSIIGMAPQILLSASVIVFGGALLIASGSTARLNSLMISNPYPEVTRTPYETPAGAEPRPFERPYEVHRTSQVAYDTMTAASSGEVLIGLAAVILGILSLIGFAPLTLTFVAFLALGASVLLTGSSFAARILGTFGH